MPVEELFEQTLFDQILHYGLLLGAVFQLIAIAAIVVISPKPEEEEADGDPGGDESQRHDSGEGSGAEGHVVRGAAPGKKSKKARKRK